MFRSFRDADAEQLFQGVVPKRLASVARVAQRKLTQLDAATTLRDLAMFPGNRLEALERNRKGQHSIRVNDRLRVCFRWEQGEPSMSRSSTTTRRETKDRGRRFLPPVHPGEVLREDLMVPLGLSINRLARELRVPVNRMSEIVNGRRGISADTALRLARYFGSTPEFWLNLQSRYDLQRASRDLATLIARDVRPRDAA